MRLTEVPHVSDLLRPDGWFNPSEPGAPGWQAAPIEAPDGRRAVYCRCMCGQPSLLCFADEIDPATGVLCKVIEHKHPRCGFSGQFKLRDWAVAEAYHAEDGA